MEIFNFEIPKKIFSSAKYIDNDQEKAIIYLIAVLWFDNDKMATFECSFNDCNRQRVEIIGNLKNKKRKKGDDSL
jgi:hypothetical protein